MENTPNLALPYLMPSQAQKHVTHNEALQMLDGLVQLSVISRQLSTPPAGAAEGDRYMVHEGEGAWAGWDDTIASFVDGTWLRLTPRTGWCCWIENEEILVVWDGSDWQSLNDSHPQTMQLESLSINSAPDNGNRFAVKSDAVLFSHDDTVPGSGNMQITVNKADVAKEAAIFFQSDWSARAGVGCFGSDRFQIKVSADGSAWTDALSIDPLSGDVGLGTATAKGRLHVTSRDYLSITVSNSNADATAKGGMVCGARHDNANTPFVCFGSWDRGATNGQREVFFGGGGWNLPDATQLQFYTAPAYSETTNTGVQRMVITSAGNVGIGVAAPSARLHVGGSLSKTTGSFDIAHPNPELRGTHRLRHCFVEAPTRGENIYRFDIEAEESGTLSIPLPAYWPHLNENPQVWVSPAGHFGRAYGIVDETASVLNVTCESAGRYNVLLIGTRHDEDACNYFDALGVEYEQADEAES